MNIIRRVLSAVLTFSMPGVLWDNEPAGGGAPAGGDAGGGAPAPAGGGAPAPTAGAAAPGAPGGGAPAPAARPAYTYQEDRSRWIHPSTLAQHKSGWERERTQLHQQLEQTRRQVHALTGATPPSPGQLEDQQLQEAMYAKFPWMKRMSSLDFDTLERVLSSSEDATSAVRHHWDNHAQQTFDRAAAAIEEAIGYDLTDRTYRRMVGLFREYAKSQPDLEAFRVRYERNDPAVIDDFVKEFLEDFVEPVRRTAAAGIANRGRVPSGSRSQPVTTQPPQQSFKSPEEAEDAGLAYMRGRGLVREA